MVINQPVFIAEDADVTNSIIGPYATISSGCKIKECIVKNSIIDSNAHVEKALLDNSIIGSNSFVRGAYKRLNSGDSSEVDFY